MKHTFTYGKYSYEYYVEFSDRKTLGLMVRPDLRIIAKVPHGTPESEVEAFLERKWVWLHQTLNQFKRYRKSRVQREYVSGESFQYLGRRYMLLVTQGTRDSVTLQRGKIQVETTESVRNIKHNKRLIDEWFEGRRERVFKRLFVQALKKFDYATFPRLQERNMSRRWGSYRQGKIFLNPRLIEAPTEAIYYVIVHELCHVRNKNHDKLFYEELGKRVPDWREVKEHLEVRYG